MSFIKKYLEENSIHQKHGDHVIYLIPANVFKDIPIKQWKYNRPSDEERVKVIHAYMETSKRVDGVIHLACVDNEIVCYDGNHRREALKGIENMNTIVVDMLWNTTDELVGEEFQRLNQSLPVPEFYNAIEADNLLREKIREYADGYCKKYKAHRSPARNPHRPNFNRDGLCDDMFRVMKELNIDIDELFMRLVALNNRKANQDKSDLAEKIMDKCTESGLWLFAWSSKLNTDELK